MRGFVRVDQFNDYCGTGGYYLRCVVDEDVQARITADQIGAVPLHPLDVAQLQLVHAQSTLPPREVCDNVERDIMCMVRGVVIVNSDQGGLLECMYR